MQIIIIDDDELDFRLIKRNLERAFVETSLEFQWIADPTKTNLSILLNEADICFIDYRLGETDGLELIQQLNRLDLTTPLVLLTGEESPELDQQAIVAGAADFLHKDKLTVSAIQRLTRHCLARKVQEQRLVDMAFKDQLTGLANRAAFDKRRQALFQGPEKDGMNIAMILVDLDHFKKINDTFGHPVGDEVLQAFSKHLASHFTSRDIVARLGGDEFGIIMCIKDNGGSPDDLRDGLRSKLQTQFQISEGKLDVFCSIGVAISDCDMPNEASADMLKRADRNLYSNKRMRHLLGSERLLSTDLGKIELQRVLKELKLSLSNSHFELMYQPKVNRGTATVTGLEALLRWCHPDIKLGPDIFIPIAEEYGLIKDIGKWALRHCCAQIETWRNAGYDVPKVAINVSPLQLEDEHFCDLVKDVLGEFHLEPDCIEFELTEGPIGEGLDSCLDQMDKVAQLGCGWAIDDFGIGYSSLSRLHKLPISRLKIDKSFVDQLPNDRAALEISNSIISMARGLGLCVVAEGVEKLSQLEGLRLDIDDEVQGYSYYKPLASQDITYLLTKNVTTLATQAVIH